MEIIKNNINFPLPKGKTVRVVEDVKKVELLCLAGGNVKSCGSCGKQYGDSL